VLWNTVKTQEVEQKEQAQPDRSRQVLEEAANSEYKYGFTSDIDTVGHRHRVVPSRSRRGGGASYIDQER